MASTTHGMLVGIRHIGMLAMDTTPHGIGTIVHGIRHGMADGTTHGTMVAIGVAIMVATGVAIGAGITTTTLGTDRAGVEWQLCQVAQAEPLLALAIMVP